MIRRSHHNSSKSKARISRIRDKAQKLREQVKRSTVAFFERREARVAWWQQAFRTPMAGGLWVFSQANALWVAFLSLIGLAPSRRASIALRTTDVVRRPISNGRSLRHEPLEGRQLMAADIFYVAGDTTGYTDLGMDGITWHGFDGLFATAGDNKTGLTLGTDFFTSVSDAKLG